MTDLYDWPAMVARMAAEEPFWEPGTAAGYHAVLWGYLPGELALRTSGRTLGTILAERIARPLDAQVHLGLPTAEHGRVADLVGPNHARTQPDLAALLEVKMPPLYRYALQNPSIRPWQDACSAPWRVAEIAAANAQANARGIARIYGCARARRRTRRRARSERRHDRGNVSAKKWASRTTSCWGGRCAAAAA